MNYFERWFSQNKFRIKVVVTKEGQAYAKPMRLWEMAGSPEQDKPESSDYGEASILSKLRTLRDLINADETVIVIMGDHNGWAALWGLNINVDLMLTRTFIAMMYEDHHVEEAATASSTLKLTRLHQLGP